MNQTRPGPGTGGPRHWAGGQGFTGMIAASCGTFVITWAQTSIGGQAAVAADQLAVGAVWRWAGRAVRLNGRADLLLLQNPQGDADLRQGAARRSRRLIGAPATPPPAVVQTDPPLDHGFVVTDGCRTWAATLVQEPVAGANLVVFASDMPPAGRDLRVVRAIVDHSPAATRAAAGGICLTPGTQIATPVGPRLIESLCPGDQVLTRDNGPCAVLWVGHRQMTGARLHAMPHLRPIRFRAGALGIDRPKGDLLTSSQHRMLLRGRFAQMLFNTAEVLVKAQDMVNGTTIGVDHALREVSYVDILLDQHNIIWANGMETESFYPEPGATDGLTGPQRAALVAIAPQLTDDPADYGGHARRCLTTTEAAMLCHRLVADGAC